MIEYWLVKYPNAELLDEIYVTRQASGKREERTLRCAAECEGVWYHGENCTWYYTSMLFKMQITKDQFEQAFTRSLNEL